jgi:hypothetical protein
MLTFLTGHAFEPETITDMALALDAVCEALGLHSATDDPVTRLIAQKIVELAEQDLRGDALREEALKAFMHQAFAPFAIR